MKVRTRVAPQPVPALAAAWLRAPGSLTARLRALGTVQVVRVRQGTQGLWPQEQADLGCRSGHVREVLILVDGAPAVWARSITARVALHGPWKALAQLGNRPLAELLFQGRRLVRSPLQAIHLPRSTPMQSRIRAVWHLAAMPHRRHDLPRWGRSSVFSRKGQALRVFEAFAPWVLQRTL